MNKWLKALIFLVLSVVITYGSVRLYFAVTDGFTIANITSDFVYDPALEMKPLTESEREEVYGILSQEFRYLGKGCQSYVFASQDGEYVLKFFKYQRFRPHVLMNLFSFIPAVADHREIRMKAKKAKLNGFYHSWKVAYENLKPESGLVYMQLNNNVNDMPKVFVFYDKIGLKHTVDLNQMEFLVQKRADMLCSSIEKLMVAGEKDKAKNLLSTLVSMIVSEYNRGLADKDQALMQNTGVYKDQPVHIDVGMFYKNEAVKNPDVYHQELFNQTYKFRLWLSEHFPELQDHLEQVLKDEIGDAMDEMKYRPRIV